MWERQENGKTYEKLKASCVIKEVQIKSIVLFLFLQTLQVFCVLCVCVKITSGKTFPTKVVGKQFGIVDYFPHR